MCLALLLALVASPALAQDAETQARTRFEAGRTSFAAGEYEEALHDFERAYELSPRPELLYNIGSAAERSAHDQGALDAYRAFVIALPDHESRDDVDRRIVVLEARLRAHASLVEPTPEPTLAPPTVPPTVRTEERGGWLLSWVALGATALAGGAAGLSWALANDAYGSLEQSCYARGCSDAQIASSDVQARLDATTAMLVVSGVLAAATIVLFIVEAPSTVETSVAIGPGSLEVRGTF